MGRGLQMNLGPSIWGRLFSGAGGWKLTLGGDALALLVGGVATRVPLADLIDLRLSRTGLWQELLVETSVASYQLVGMQRKQAAAFRQLVVDHVVSRGLLTVESAVLEAPIGDAHIDEFLAQKRYVARRDVQRWVGELTKTSGAAAALVSLLERPLFVMSVSFARLPPWAVRFHDLVNGPRSELTRRNGRYVESELVRMDEFFNAIERLPLTLEQRRAAVISEDRNLVVAAAGSGKTSVVVAKIGYALTTGACRPAEVLALAFNKTAAEELRERTLRRLEEKVADLSQMRAQTFHKLGLEIIAAAEGRKPSLAPWATETADNAGAIIQELVDELSQRDVAFLLRWHLFRAIAARPIESVARFKSMAEYDAHLAQVGQVGGGEDGIRTLNGELVKSMEEAAIANWLFFNGVPYEYEKPYEYETADQEHRQYQPDFFYPDINLYHEHFALDENGNAPSFFSAGYEAGVEWKRSLHETKATGLIETTSASFRYGTVFALLEQMLKDHGQLLKPRTAADIEDRLGELRVPKFEALFKTFISLSKAGGIKSSELVELADKQSDKFRARLFIDVVRTIYDAYEERLQALRCIDFEDMIWRAVGHIEAGRYVHPYKLILVDEFQDISRSRAELVKAMLRQEPGSQLFAVGDDWQSIYRFAGADQSIMVNFEAEFGVTETSFLTKTFRCNQGIADLSSKFIQRNPQQIAKCVTSQNERRASTVHVLEYGRDDEVEAILEAEIASLAQHASERSAKVSILVLSRFRHLRPAKLRDWQKQHEAAVDLQFLTLHRSKGLEADYVFILGCNSGVYGLPSGMADDPLLAMVLPAAEPFAHAEERRLFYVGLTRARHRCHVFAKRGVTSPFVRDLLSDGGELTYRLGKPHPARVCAKPCDRCASGVMREVAGKQGPEFECSNSSRFKRRARQSAVKQKI